MSENEKRGAYKLLALGYYRKFAIYIVILYFFSGAQALPTLANAASAPSDSNPALAYISSFSRVSTVRMTK